MNELEKQFLLELQELMAKHNVVLEEEQGEMYFYNKQENLTFEVWPVMFGERI